MNKNPLGSCSSHSPKNALPEDVYDSTMSLYNKTLPLDVLTKINATEPEKLKKLIDTFRPELSSKFEEIQMYLESQTPSPSPSPSNMNPKSDINNS